MSHKKSVCTCNQYTDYKGCCETLNSFINDCKVGLEYDKPIRMISILIKRNRRQGITHCPWCGTQLPSILIDTREEVLKKEFNIDLGSNEDEKRIPAEFLTDEWWKKRGL